MPDFVIKFLKDLALDLKKHHMMLKLELAGYRGVTMMNENTFAMTAVYVESLGADVDMFKLHILAQKILDDKLWNDLTFVQRVCEDADKLIQAMNDGQN